jgi:prephenate dehydrogenase
VSIRSVTIVGLGLIGGSVARAARRKNRRTIRAVDPSETSRAFARANGIADEVASPDEAQAAGWFAPGASDLVVLGTPVPATIEWLERLRALGYDGIVTDVASTKQAVAAFADSLQAAYRFVGGHPMTGSERSGVEAAAETLFDGAYYILTPTAHTDTDAYRRVHAFVTSLGARVISIDATAHDEAVAVVSHVPHVAAAALVELASERAESGGADVLRLAAGGFKDTTRVAAGSPELWTSICLDNADALASGIADLERLLEEFRIRVLARDAEAVRAWFERPAEVRRSLPAQWVPETARLTQLSVPVTDRPGVVGAVTTAASRAGCNIEDIEIDHRSEASAVLRLVLTDEGDIDALVRDLAEAGFEPVVSPLEEGAS